VKTSAPFDVEMRIRSNAGSYRWFRTRAVPIRDSEGRVTKWYGASMDIDELKRCEDRLSAVLDTMTEAFIALDRHLQVVSLNAAARTLLGRSREDVEGRVLFEVWPASRDLEKHVRNAPASRDVVIDGARYTARTELDHDTGYWIFLQPGGAAS
jgi:PAS domain S-box-containing protein